MNSFQGSRSASVRTTILALPVLLASLVASAPSYSQELQIVLDQYGRYVLVDPRIGEVVAVEGPDGEWVPAWRERRDRGREFGRDHRQSRDLFYEKWFGNPDDQFDEDVPRNERGYRMRDGRVERRALPDDIEPRFDDPREDQGRDGGEEIAGIERPPENPVKAIARDGKTVAALQVLLDRAGASPGVIDGRWGQNGANALAAYREMTGKTLDPTDSSSIEAELSATGGPALVEYTITKDDSGGPFVPAIPADYAEKARMATLGFVSPREKLAEKFHMDEGFLASLNPGADFGRPGETITVANTGRNVSREVVRIVADKSREQVLAYDGNGALVAAYPSTIGSSDTPSPSGRVTVDRIAFDPEYTYNPKVNFKQGDNDGILTIPPGPNGPVGTIWIALSKPTYGIHGTPEPSKIGKTNSHGCVRLTNWDATELAGNIKKGVMVEFVD